MVPKISLSRLDFRNSTYQPTFYCCASTLLFKDCYSISSMNFVNASFEINLLFTQYIILFRPSSYDNLALCSTGNRFLHLIGLCTIFSPRYYISRPTSFYYIFIKRGVVKSRLITPCLQKYSPRYFKLEMCSFYFMTRKKMQQRYVKLND